MHLSGACLVCDVEIVHEKFERKNKQNWSHFKPQLVSMIFTCNTRSHSHSRSTSTESFDWVVIVLTPCRAYRQSTWLTPTISTLSPLSIPDLFEQWITAFENIFDSILLLLPPLIAFSSGIIFFFVGQYQISFTKMIHKCYSLVFISS